MNGKHIHILILSVMAIMAVSMVSCTPDWKEEMTPFPSGSEEHPGLRPGRDISSDSRKVMLLYSAGYNSLSSYLRSDIEELCTGWMPEDRRSEDVILVYSHLTSRAGDYKTKTSPVLFRLYGNEHGEVVRDTLVVYVDDVISSSAEQFHSVLSFVKDEFPAGSYGLIFSSHATGYLPSGFYSKPDSYTFTPGKMMTQGQRSGWSLSPVPYIENEQDPDLPAVKSIGQDVSGRQSYEITIQDFAEAIPMKLDYILFDACLMGGIEVAYELADKCNVVGFSQTEVLAEGFNYSTLASHLLGNKPSSDPASVCSDYFDQYINQSGVYQSATISLVDCNKLEPLAEACADLFDRYSSEISWIQGSHVQRYYRYSHHWFYDLESILVNAGIHDNDLRRFRQALDGCIIYKGATPNFMNEFAINTFSGLSMYLPSNGNRELDKFYKTLKWNKATRLVK
ncbi:MAG: hypothetical protein E7113_00360 [Bacteroidales bacterium]|nr:hypothetical protein [Bacteroidales bacterium]